MTDCEHRSVPPSAPPVDFCPSSPPPSYASSPTAPRNNANDGQQQNTAKGCFLPSCKKAKSATKENDAGGTEPSQPTSAAVVVPMAKDKVTILCLGHNSQCCQSADRFAIFQSVSGRRSRNKLRKLLAFGCCAFSVIIFGFFAFAVGFIFVVLVDSQMTENDAFEQYQMRMFGHHFG
ncbi:hypothetical protein niasHT_039709 [Heterodera trifolii]|uniref:Transmembrane protein n=1 Tax=Heterodera trifolii TaxID=157864 RepID=A0ABD2ICJ7_9BILA